MEQLLWNFDQIEPFAHHRDIPLRRWALERLTRWFPDRAGEVSVTMLTDPDRIITSQALDFLAETGQTETYGPVLLEHLQQAEEDRFGRLALALAKLNYRPALPVLLDYLRHRGLELEKLSGYSFMAQALGRFGGEEVCRALWETLDQESLPEMVSLPLLEALAQTARPEDIPRLIEYWRDRDRDGYFSRRSGPAELLAESVEAGRLVNEMESSLKQGLKAMLKQAAWWLDTEIRLSRPGMVELEQAIAKERYANVPEILWTEAQRLAETRVDDLAGWQAAWAAGAPPGGYRRRAIYTWLILKALAQPPAEALNRQHQKKEALLGLSLLVYWITDRDDQVHLEAATDKTEALLAILAEPRPHVLPDIVDQVVALGPEIAPRLIDLLDPDDEGWVPIRIIQSLERLAGEYPHSADAAVPKLIQAINEEQGDYIKKAAADALTAIGPPAVDLINQELRTTQDLSRKIYLTDVLGHIPVERGTEVILAQIEAGQPISEMELTVLSSIGSDKAIEPLYQLWEPGDIVLAQHLLILCELNGVKKPELPEWRQLVVAEDERMAKILSGEMELEDFDLQEALNKLASGDHPLFKTWQLKDKQPPAHPGSPSKIQRRCPDDGFPMIKIKGQWQCVPEYIDRCIGQQPIADVIQAGKTVYYVFENGHQLPLLCSCCGGNLVIDVEQERKDKIGRRLESMSIGYTHSEEGEEIEELVLEFSKKGLLSSIVGMPVSFQVAAQMRHPSNCPYGSRAQTSKTKVSESKKKKKRKKRPGRKRGGRN